MLIQLQTVSHRTSPRDYLDDSVDVLEIDYERPSGKPATAICVEPMYEDALTWLCDVIDHGSFIVNKDGPGYLYTDADLYIKIYDGYNE